MPKITQINNFDFFSILEMILSVRSTLINAWQSMLKYCYCCLQIVAKGRILSVRSTLINAWQSMLKYCYCCLQIVAKSRKHFLYPRFSHSRERKEENFFFRNLKF
jgi:hypothetical protein